MSTLHVIISIIAIIIIGTIYFFVFHKTPKNTQSNLSEKFSEVQPLQTEPNNYTDISVPASFYKEQSTTPIKGGENVYFNENIPTNEVVAALNLSMTGQLDEVWSDLIEINKKHGYKHKDAIIKLIEESLNSYIRVEDLPFKVKGAILKECVSKTGKSDMFYTKWDIVAHRGNKMHGFTFEVIFLHMDDQLYLAHHSKHNALFEDSIETITKLPNM